MECMVNGAKLYYETHGAGKPVVMLHGFSVDHRLMTGCMEPVCESYGGLQRIYLDLPGMGASDAPSWVNGSDDMLDAVVACIEQIIPSQRFLLTGESYGGYLAQGLVSRMRSKVDGLLLLCPVVIAQRDQRSLPEKTVCLRDEAFLAGLSEEEAEDFDEMAVIQNEYTYTRIMTEIMPGIDAANETLLQRVSAHYFYTTPLYGPDFESFSKPSLFLAGRQDAVVGYQDLQSIIEHYLNASVVILDNAGHNLQIEQPELFNALVKEWLDRCLRNP